METHPAPLNDFKQRRGGDGKLRVWTWDVDHRITIRERLNSSAGVGYRVTLPKGVTGGRVIFLQSRDFDKAKEMARGKAQEFRQSRSTALILGDAQKLQAASAIRTLAASGIETGLDDIARQYSEASKLLADLGLSLPQAAKQFAEAMQAAKPTGKTLAQVVGYAVERLCPQGGVKTLAELAAEMKEIKIGWEKRGDLRPASLRDFKDRAGKIAKEIGSFPLASLTKAIVYDWLNGLGLAPRTLKNYRMVLAEMLRYAEQKQYIVKSPLAEFTRQDIKEIEGSSRSANQPAILAPSEAEKLLRLAFARPELDLGAAVVLGLFGGIRTEEIKRLSWDAVRLDEEHPFVVIGPEIAKKRRIRNVPLPAVAVAWLRQWTRGETITRHGHSNDYQKRFMKLASEAKIAWEANAMRHSFGSYHFAKDGNSIETARILGHKADDSVLFAHYRALTTKAQADAYFSIYPPKSDGKLVAFPSAG